VTKLLLLYCTELYGSNGGRSVTHPEGFFLATDPGVTRYYKLVQLVVACHNPPEILVDRDGTEVDGQLGIQ